MHHLHRVHWQAIFQIALVNPNTVGNYLNVRVQADESAEVVNTIKAEELVSVLGEDGDWTKIGVDDMEGWVKTEYLLTGEEAAAYMQENGTLYARVTVPEYEHSSSSYNICRYPGCSIRIRCL